MIPHRLLGGLVLTALLAVVLLTLAGAAPYDRAAWPHWARAGACDVRHAVLARDAAPGTLRTDPIRPCRVLSGRWMDPYTGVALARPDRLDVDHVVPLQWAHEHGGAAWDQARRQAYANDLSYRGHLLAVDRRANRAKGARGPAAWAPVGNAARCDYGHRWAAVLVVWDLRPGEADRAAIRDLLRGCR